MLKRHDFLREANTVHRFSKCSVRNPRAPR